MIKKGQTDDPITSRWYTLRYSGCSAVVPPCSVCEVDSASEPQFDWTRGPRMVTSELPRFISAAFSGATWLNWTDDRQPTKPLDAACATFSLKFSLPAGRKTVSYTHYCLEREGWGNAEAWVLSSPVTLPNVRDLIRISSASDDSVYFVWMSWSIWLSGKKSNNKVITRNPSRGNSRTGRSSRTGTRYRSRTALFTVLHQTVSAHRRRLWSELDLSLLHRCADSVASLN